MRERVRTTGASVLEGHDQRVRVRRVLCAMAVVVAALVAWWLMGTAYAKTAAPETQSQWEATLPSDLTHADVDADTASIASSQDGYKQATSVDAQGNRQAWNRYAAAVDGDQSKGWNAYFVAFCLHYAGVDLPDDHDTATQLRDWAKEHNAYAEGASNDVKPGQLLFLKQGAMKDVATTDDGMLVGVVLSVEDGHARVALGAYESSTSATPYVEEQKTVSLDSSDVLGVADPAKVVNGDAGSSAASADSGQTSTAAAVQALAVAPAAASADQDGSADGASASNPTSNDQSEKDMDNAHTFYNVSDPKAKRHGVEVQVTLYANGVPQAESVTLGADNDWTYTWKSLPKTDDAGNTVTYEVKATDTSDDWQTSVESASSLSDDEGGTFQQVTTDKLPSFNDANPYLVVHSKNGTKTVLGKDNSNDPKYTSNSDATALIEGATKPDDEWLFNATAVTNPNANLNRGENDFVLRSVAKSNFYAYFTSYSYSTPTATATWSSRAMKYDAQNKVLAFDYYNAGTADGYDRGNTTWPLGDLTQLNNAGQLPIAKSGDSSNSYELYEWLPQAGTSTVLSTVSTKSGDLYKNDDSELDTVSDGTTFVHVKNPASHAINATLYANGTKVEDFTVDASGEYLKTDLPRTDESGNAITYTVLPQQDSGVDYLNYVDSIDHNAGDGSIGKFQQVNEDTLPSFNEGNPYLVTVTKNGVTRTLGVKGSNRWFVTTTDNYVSASTKPDSQWLFTAEAMDVTEDNPNEGDFMLHPASASGYHFRFDSYTSGAIIANLTNYPTWNALKYDGQGKLSFDFVGSGSNLGQLGYGNNNDTWPLGDISTIGSNGRKNINIAKSGDTSNTYELYEWTPARGTEVVLNATTPLKTTFTVNKNWTDGSTGHDPINVTLQQNKLDYTPSDGSGTVTLSSPSWSYTWENLPAQRVNPETGELEDALYNVKEDVSDGYKVTYGDTTSTDPKGSSIDSGGTYTNVQPSNGELPVEDGKEYVINYWGQSVLACDPDTDEVKTVKINEISNYKVLNSQTSFNVASTGISNPYVVWQAHATGNGGFQLTNPKTGKTLAIFTPDGGSNYYVHTETNPDASMSSVKFTFSGHGRPVFVGLPDSVPHSINPNFQLQRTVGGKSYLWVNRYGQICMHYGIYEFSSKPTEGEQAQTITNTAVPKTSVSVQKSWEDSDGNPTAPEDVSSVNVLLQRSTDGFTWTTYDTQALSADNGWEYSWSNLDTQDADGKAYSWQVVEDPSAIPSGYNIKSQSTKANDGGSGYTATIVNKEKTGYTLPSFGGSGTMPFYLLGIASIVAAISSLALRNKAQRRRLQGAGHAAEGVAPARRGFGLGWGGFARGEAGQKPIAKWAGAFVAALAIAVTVALAGFAAPQQAQAQTLSGSVQVQPSEKMAAAGDAQVTYDLYKVADVDVDDSGAAVAVHPYDVASDVSLEPGSDSQVAQAANALESRVLMDGVAPTQSRTVAASQTAVFDSLDAGVYLMRVEFASTLELKASASIISIPDQAQGTSVTVSPKVEAVHVPPTPVSLSVAKAWDDGASGSVVEHPAVKVQLTRDGVAYGDPVELNEQSNWRHSWYELDPGSEWGVVELDVPDGYTVGQSAPTSNDDGTSQEVVIVNTAQTPPPTTPQTPQPTPSSGLPATGEQLTVALMLLVAGLACFAVGMAQAARRGRSQGKGGAAHGRR